MASDALTFNCPSCGIRLTIPVSMAGITGPCPQCRVTIEAPKAMAAQAPIEFAAQTTAAAPVQPSAPQPEISRSVQPVDSSRLRTIPASPPTPQKPTSIAIRLIFPILFLLVGAGLVFGLLQYFGKSGATPPTPDKPTKTIYVSPSNSGSTVRKILDDDPPKPADQAPVSTSPLPPPPDDEPKSAPVDPLLSQDSGESAVPAPAATADPSSEEFSIVGKFLDAKGLEERLPLIETKSTKAELAKTILARPLPERMSIEPGARISNSVENLTDCFYTVTLAGKNQRGDAYTILVRRRSGQPPRILAEPLLDLMGGRLAAFAAAPPNDDLKTFQVILIPSSFVDDKVPNPDKKITLRIVGAEGAPPIATAYASQASKIYETLKDPTAGLLRYGNPQPCTVVMEWNRREDPKKPYLEIVEIKAFTWNP